MYLVSTLPPKSLSEMPYLVAMGGARENTPTSQKKMTMSFLLHYLKNMTPFIPIFNKIGMNGVIFFVLTISAFKRQPYHHQTGSLCRKNRTIQK